jgi:two-component system response regulator DesR
MIRTLVVEDEGRLSVHVRALLEDQPDIEMVGRLSMDDDLVVEVAPLAPQVMVIDTELMVSQVLPVAAELRARFPRCALLLLCDPAKRGMLPPRRHGNDISYLLKSVSGQLLAQSVRRLANGERIVSPDLQMASLHTQRELSTRELTVLGLAAEGDSVTDIARRLYLSGGTVRNYLSAVIFKTGARNRLDAIRIVRKAGWLR